MRTAGGALTDPTTIGARLRSIPAWALVLGSIAAAGVLRFGGIQAKSLWGDEIIALALAAGHSWYPWLGEETELFYSASHYRDQLTLAPDYFSHRLLALLRQSDQSPFYYVVLNLWLHLVGTSEAAVRSLSLLASVASVPVLYALGRLISGHAAALYASWIFALAPYQIVFALYNRPYAFLGFFALLSTLAAVHVSREGAHTRWLLTYAVAVVLGMYSHYLFLWNLVFQVPFVLFHQRRNRSALIRFGLACFCAALVCVLWVPILLAQSQWSREVGANSWFYWYSGAPTLLGTVVSLGHTVLKLLSAGELRICGQVGAGAGCGLDTVVTVVSYAVPMMASAGVGWSMLRHYRGSTGRRTGSPDPWTLCLLWGGCVMAGPVIMDALLSSHMVYSHRYFIAASGPVYLTVAMALGQVAGPSLRRSLGGGFLVFLFVSSVLYLRGSSPTMMHEVGAREAAKHIDRQSTGADDLVLVLDPGFSPLDYAYYLKSNPDIARVRVPAWRPSAPDIPTQLQAITGARPRARIWYIDERGLEAEARARALEWLRIHFVEVEVTEFTNLGLFLFWPRRVGGAGAPSEGSGLPARAHLGPEPGTDCGASC